jgi:membrane protease YdiL (CAAX protease family)
MAPITPPEADRSIPVLAGVVLSIVAVASMYGIVAALGALRAYISNVPFAQAAQHVSEDLLTLTLAQLCGFGSALFVGLRMFDGDASLAEAVSALPVRTRILGLCFLSGLCLQFPLAELANCLHAYVFGPDPLAQQLALQHLLEARNLPEGARVVGCLVAAVPAIEELFFRGFLLFGFERRHGPWIALIASSGLFGMAHLGAGWVPVLYASTAGLALGSVALWTRSVLPGMAMHSAVNAMPVLLPARVIAIRGFNVPAPQVLHLPVWLVGVSLVLGIVLLAWVRRIEYAHAR